MNKVQIRPCPSFPGYSATSEGKVISHRTRHGRPGVHNGSIAVIDPNYKRVLSQYINKKGYREVGLTVDGITRPRGVHTVVLDAFKGPKPYSDQVGRHLDGNPANNTPPNLSWGTHTDNAQDRMRHGRYSRGDKHHNAKLSNEQAQLIRCLRGQKVKVKSLAYRFGVSTATIESVIYGKSYK